MTPEEKLKQAISKAVDSFHDIEALVKEESHDAEKLAFAIYNVWKEANAQSPEFNDPSGLWDEDEVEQDKKKMALVMMMKFLPMPTLMALTNGWKYNEVLAMNKKVWELIPEHVSKEA